MAKNLSRRRVLTHNDFMRFGGIEPKKTRSRGAKPSPAKIRRQVDALIGTRCGCSINDLEADSNKFACPCGSHCTDPTCVAENKRRRSGLRKRHHEAKPTTSKPKRWSHKDVARSYDVPEAVVRRIYAAVQTAKKQGLYAGYLADLIERSVGRKLIYGEYDVAARAKKHLGYDMPSGYGGPRPTGAAAEPVRPSSCDSRVREAARLRDPAERVIKDAIAGSPAWDAMVATRNRERLRRATDELEVAADLYEAAGLGVLAGTVRERARMARGGEYRKLSVYHVRKKKQ